MLVASPVIDSIDQIEVNQQRDTEYVWWRYSKLALPFLVLLLLLSSTVLVLSLWQGNLTIKDIKAGTPRYYQLTSETREDAAEAGLPQKNRRTRIAAFIFVYAALIATVLVMYLRPAPKARLAAYKVAAAIFLIGGIIGVVAFGLDAGNVNEAVRCRAREQGNVVVPNPCKDYSTFAVTVTVLDLVVAFFAIVTGLVLFFAAGQSAPEAEDEYVVTPGKGVTQTTKNILLLLLLATFVFTVLLTVFTVLLHEARDLKYADEVHAVRYFNNGKPGWPIKNTRLRIAVGAIVAGTVLLNLIPFRSRVVAYVFAFLYFAASVLAVTAFSLDTKAVDTARDYACPADWECKDHAFLATIILELFLAVVLVAYVFVEFVARVVGEFNPAA